MANLSIFAPVKSRAGLLTRDAYIKNVFVEPNGQESMYVCRRPGLLPYSTNTATPATGRGIAAMKDYLDVEHLLIAQGGSLYSDGILRTAGTWSEIATPLITSGSHYMLYPSLIVYRGLLFAFGPGHTTDIGPTLGTRFMAAYSRDDGATWNILVNVATGTSGYPLGTTPYHVCVYNDKVWLLGSYNATTVWTTTNGVAFTQVTATSGMVGTLERVVAHSDSKMKAFTDGSTVTTPRVYESSDGVTWTLLTSTPAFAGSNGRYRFGVVSYAGSLYLLGGYCAGGLAESRRVYRSTDNGTTWAELGSQVLTGIITNSVSTCDAFMAGPIAWLCLQVDNTSVNRLYYSTDFQTWTLFKTETTETFELNYSSYHSAVRLVNDYFVAVTTNSSANARIARMNAPISGSAQVSIGSLAGQFFDFAQNASRDTLAIKSDVAAYGIDVVNGVITQVSDVDYPPLTVRGLVSLDGYYFVMDPDGYIFGSAGDDFTSWSALNVIQAEFEPDGGVALAKYVNYVVAFGQYTTEFFYDAGNATASPLSPVQNGVMNVGCVDGDTVQTIDSELMWIAQTKSGGQSAATGRFAAKLNGTSYQKFSTPDIDRLLDADDFADVDATTFKVGGHSYYHLRLGTSNISLVFDLSLSQWYVWTTRRTSFTHTVTNVVTASGTATATVTHSFSDGDVAVVSAFTGTHTALNGTYNVTAPGSTTLLWNVGTAYSGTATGTGTATGYSEDDFPVVCAANYSGRQLLQDKSNGIIYTLDGDTYRDNGVYMDFVARLEKTDGKTNNPKFAAYADFISDRASGNALLRFSDDDCQTWTRFKPKSMAGQRTRWNRLGNFRRRNFEVRVTDNIPVRAERLELTAVDEEAGANG